MPHQRIHTLCVPAGCMCQCSSPKLTCPPTPMWSSTWTGTIAVHNLLSLQCVRCWSLLELIYTLHALPALLTEVSGRGNKAACSVCCDLYGPNPDGPLHVVSVYVQDEVSASLCSNSCSQGGGGSYSSSSKEVMAQLGVNQRDTWKIASQQDHAETCIFWLCRHCGLQLGILNSIAWRSGHLHSSFIHSSSHAAATAMVVCVHLAVNVTAWPQAPTSIVQCTCRNSVGHVGSKSMQVLSHPA